MFHHFDHQMIGICVLSKSQAMRPELIIYALPLCWSTILYTCLLTNNCPHVRITKATYVTWNLCKMTDLLLEDK
jgi:hypothetical protein